MLELQEKEIINKIENALSKIRPYLEADGGDIELVEVTKDFIVKVKLLGTCSTCDISLHTLNNGVETAIKEAVPQVKKVIEISASK